MRVDSEETAITVPLALVGGECCSVADEVLKASPGAASDVGKTSAIVVPDFDKGACVAVNVMCAGGKGSDGGGDKRDSEKVGGICRLGPERLQSAGLGLIQLGCGCNDELVANRHRSEALNELRRNRNEYDLEFTEKFDRYQADYVRWIKAKYFSKKSFDGGNIYDMETTIDSAVIKSSRWQCTRSFLDPVLTIEDQSRLILPPLAAETSSTMPSRKHHFKKISYHS